MNEQKHQRPLQPLRHHHGAKVVLGVILLPRLTILPKAIALFATTCALGCARETGAFIPLDELTERVAEFRCRQTAGQHDKCVNAEVLFGASRLRARIHLVELGRLKYDASQASKCLSAIDNWGDIRQLPHWLRNTSTSGVPDPSRCVGVFRNNLAVGQSCDLDEECESSACVGCDGKTCQLPLATAAPCGPGSRCAPGNVCEAGRCTPCGSAQDENAECRSNGSAGDACSSFLACAPGLSCVAGKCSNALVVGLGDTCGFGRNVKFPCSFGSYCPWTADTVNRCVAALPEDATCDQGDSCESGFRCDGSSPPARCLKETGGGLAEPCEDAGCKWGLRCVWIATEATSACWPLDLEFPCGDRWCAPEFECVKAACVRTGPPPQDSPTAIIDFPTAKSETSWIPRLFSQHTRSNWCGPGCHPLRCNLFTHCDSVRIGEPCSGDIVDRFGEVNLRCINGFWRVVDQECAR